MKSHASSPIPFATPQRAAEIAAMEDFGLPEFTELTGIGVPGFGMFELSEKGISIRSADNLGALPAFHQHIVHQAVRLLTLGFPCSPHAFKSWHDATGQAVAGVLVESGPIPLAEGFAMELRREAKAHGDGPAVPSRAIIAAFKVKPDKKANADWWYLRLRHPGRYQLSTARATKGGAKKPSRWYPTVVAAWLIEREHLDRDSVIKTSKAFQDLTRISSDLVPHQCRIKNCGIALEDKPATQTGVGESGKRHLSVVRTHVHRMPRAKK